MSYWTFWVQILSSVLFSNVIWVCSIIYVLANLKFKTFHVAKLTFGKINSSRVVKTLYFSPANIALLLSNSKKGGEGGGGGVY